MGDRAELEKLRRLKELEARVATKKPPDQSVTAPKDSVEGMSGMQKFGRGMQDRLNINAMKLTKVFDDLGRGGLNLAGADVGDTPSNLPWSTASIRAREAKAKPVNETGAGVAGEVVADTIMTAPLGFVGRAMQAGRSLPLAGRVLESRPAQAAVEGGIAGTLNADPEARGEGALEGATVGTLLERGGRALGRTLEGLVYRSPEARRLEEIADLQGGEMRIPLAQAASDEGIISPLAKFAYGRVLPSFPGADSALRKQQQRAIAQFRELAMREGAPGGMGSASPGYAAGLPKTTRKAEGAGLDVRKSMDDIQKAFESEYNDTIRAYAFNKPDVTKFTTVVQKKYPNLDAESLNRVATVFDNLSEKFTKNDILQGTNLVRMRNEIGRIRKDVQDPAVDEALASGQEYLDDIVRTELTQGGKKQNLIDLQRYEDLAVPYRNFLRVQRAAARSGDSTGQFTPQELTRSVKTMSKDPELARGAAPMQELASLGERTVGQKMENPSFLERGATMAVLGGAGWLGGPAGAGGLWAAGRTAASPVVQDLLMGTNRTQKSLVEALRKRPTSKRLTGAGIRNVLAGEVAEDEPQQ